MIYLAMLEIKDSWHLFWVYRPLRSSNKLSRPCRCQEPLHLHINWESGRTSQRDRQSKALSKV